MPIEQERRRVRRMLRLKGGRIIFNDLQSVMNCQLRDISPAGARLAIVNTLGTPDEFLVEVPGVAERRWVRRAWSKLNEMGVAFVQPV
jgi:hypothetical protein